MIRVADEDEIGAFGGKPGVVGRHAAGDHVGEAPRLDRVLQACEKLAIDVERVDPARRTDDRCQASGEVAGSGAEIGHGLTSGEVERRDDFIRLLPIRA